MPWGVKNKFEHLLSSHYRNIMLSMSLLPPGRGKQPPKLQIFLHEAALYNCASGEFRQHEYMLYAVQLDVPRSAYACLGIFKMTRMQLGHKCTLPDTLHIGIFIFCVHR